MESRTAEGHRQQPGAIYSSSAVVEAVKPFLDTDVAKCNAFEALHESSAQATAAAITSEDRPALGGEGEKQPGAERSLGALARSTNGDGRYRDTSGSESSGEGGSVCDDHGEENLESEPNNGFDKMEKMQGTTGNRGSGTPALDSWNTADKMPAGEKEKGTDDTSDCNDVNGDDGDSVLECCNVSDVEANEDDDIDDDGDDAEEGTAEGDSEDDGSEREDDDSAVYSGYQMEDEDEDGWSGDKTMFSDYDGEDDDDDGDFIQFADGEVKPEKRVSFANDKILVTVHSIPRDQPVSNEISDFRRLMFVAKRALCPMLLCKMKLGSLDCPLYMANCPLEGMADKLQEASTRILNTIQSVTLPEAGDSC